MTCPAHGEMCIRDRDGHSVRLYANIAGTDDLPLLRESGAEGVGLLRSEFLYLGRSTYPTEDELFESYKTVVQAMDGREVIIRTLDIGADKQVGYFDMPPEDNPALGLRAVSYTHLIAGSSLEEIMDELADVRELKKLS